MYRNFMMHLCNLFDNNIISADDYFKSVQKLQKLLSNHDEGRKAIIDARKEQVDYWDKVGAQKQINQQKKSQVKATVSEKITQAEKTNKKETKSKLDDEKLHTAVVNLKNSRNGVTNSSGRKRDTAQSKEENNSIKRRRSSLRGKRMFLL